MRTLVLFFCIVFLAASEEAVTLNTNNCPNSVKRLVKSYDRDVAKAQAVLAKAQQEFEKAQAKAKESLADDLDKEMSRFTKRGDFENAMRVKTLIETVRPPKDMLGNTIQTGQPAKKQSNVSAEDDWAGHTFIFHHPRGAEEWKVSKHHVEPPTGGLASWSEQDEIITVSFPRSGSVVSFSMQDMITGKFYASYKLRNGSSSIVKMERKKDIAKAE